MHPSHRIITLYISTPARAPPAKPRPPFSPPFLSVTKTSARASDPQTHGKCGTTMREVDVNCNLPLRCT